MREPIPDLARKRDCWSLSGERAIFATMHGKEHVVAPLLRRGLGLLVETLADFDSDRFGTFTGDVARAGSQLDAARAKIEAAFAAVADLRVALASEGRFGPDPQFPIAACGREIVVLVDRERGLELIGHDLDRAPVLAHEIVLDHAAARAFAARIGFPAQGLIVRGVVEGRPCADVALEKDVDDLPALDAAVARVLALCGAAFVETDQRAHRNPRRREAIARATRDLIARFAGRCPSCARPGFSLTERVAGVPCGWCGEPTSVIRAEIWSCAGCEHRDERVRPIDAADPGACAVCNP